MIECALRAALACVILGGLALLGPERAAAQQSSEPTSTPNQVEIRDLPTVTLTAQPGSGPAPLTVGFLADVIDPESAGIASCKYTFGDGNVSTLPPPYLVFNTYAQPGSYLVTLNVTTMDGRAASAFTGIVVTAPGAGR